MARNRRPGGRITPKGSTPSTRSRTVRHPDREAVDVADTSPSSRYTPRDKDVVVRPRWHWIIGWIGVALGLLIIVLNDGMLMGDDLVLLPFGHSELYLMFGLLVAGLSTRYLGLFERETVYL